MTARRSRERFSKIQTLKLQNGHHHVVPGQIGAGHREVPLHQQHPHRPREEDERQEGLHCLRCVHFSYRYSYKIT